MLRYVRASKLLLLPVLNIHSQVSCPNWDNCVLPRIFFGSFAMFSLSPRTGFFFSHPFLLYLCTCFLHSHICKVAQPSFPCSYHILVTSLMFQQDRFTRFSILQNNHGPVSSNVLNVSKFFKCCRRRCYWPPRPRFFSSLFFSPLPSPTEWKLQR